jgi:hypothetical protein
MGLYNQEIEEDGDTASSGDEFEEVEDFSESTFNHCLILDLGGDGDKEEFRFSSKTVLFIQA